MEFEEEVNPKVLLAFILFHLSLNFFKGEVTSVDPSFSLSHESVNSFDGVDFGIGIRHEDNFLLIFVNTHTQNSVLSEIDVFIVQNLFLRVRIDRSEVGPNDFGK